MNGTLALNGGTVSVTNNLTLNGTATMTNEGILQLFTTATSDTQTLSGSGTVTFSRYVLLRQDQITQSVSGGTA